MAADWPNLAGDGIVFLELSAILPALGFGCFAARTYTSWRCTKRFLLDYWLSLLTFVGVLLATHPLMLATWKFADHYCGEQVLCVVSQVFFVIAVTSGLGSHARHLAHADVVVAVWASWVSQITGILATVIGKLSIVAFLCQIRGRHRGRPWLLYAIAATNVAVNAIVVVLILVQCMPLEKLWDQKVPGHCSLRPVNNSYAFFQGGYSAFSDTVLAVYPMYLIWGLQASARMKIGLSFLLGAGLLAAAVAVAKTVQLSNLSHGDEEMDVTFFIARLAIATLVEAWIVLAAGCIPTLRPLMRAAVKRIRRGTTVKRQRTPFYGVEHYGMPSARSMARSAAARNESTSKRREVGHDSSTFELCESSNSGSGGIESQGDLAGGSSKPATERRYQSEEDIIGIPAPSHYHARRAEEFAAV